LNLGEYLPEEMVRPLNLLAEILASNSLSQLTAMLSVVASLTHPKTSLTLIEASKFKAKPIFYSAIVGESGTAKSPTMDIFVNPIKGKMQYEADLEYKRDLKEWQNYKGDPEDEPEKPKPIEYYIEDCTSEKIAEIINDQPDKGFLIPMDELAGLIKQNNAYRGGRGSDTEKLLSGRDGSGWKVNRKNGARYSNQHSSYSIVGGIQPDVLRKQMGNHQDENGYWARFVYSPLAVKKARFPDEGVKIDIEPMLLGLYKNIESLPAIQYYPEKQGRAAYKAFFEEMEECKVNEPNQALRAVYSKYKRVAGEIALLLKMVHLGFYNSVDTVDTVDNSKQKIEPFFIEAGIKLAKRYIREIKAIYVKADETNQSHKYQSIISLSQRKGWLKARDVKMSNRSFKSFSTQEIRTIFNELVELGFGDTKGKGNKLEWKYEKTVDTVDTLLTPPSTLCQQSESIDLKGKKSIDDLTVDTVDSISTFSHDSAFSEKPININVNNVNNVNKNAETFEDKETKTVDNSVNNSQQNVNSFEEKESQNAESLTEYMSTVSQQNVNSFEEKESQNAESLTEYMSTVGQQNVNSFNENVNSSDISSEFIGKTLQLPAEENGQIQSIRIEAYKGGENSTFICRNNLTNNLIELPATSIFNLLELDFNQNVFE
jgi:CRISPR-associated protein Cmr3